MTLEEFLLARIAEDEAVARNASGGTVEGEYGNWTPVSSGDEWEASVSRDGDVELLVALRKGLRRPPDVMGGYWGRVTGWADNGYGMPIEDYGKAVSPHIARWDPARVLAECEAKRRIVELAKDGDTLDGIVRNEYDTGPNDRPYFGDVLLAALALPYAGHEDYRPEWRVATS